MKRITAMVLSLLLVFGQLTFVMGEAPSFPDGEGTPVRVHYHRFDSNYEGWNLWLWPEGGAGSAYQFSQEGDFGMIAEVMVPGVKENGNIGIIVRLNEWEAKDVAIDRYMSVSEMDDEGILNVWLIQGDETLYYDSGDVDLSPKIMSANVLGMDRIEVNVSVPFNLDDYKNLFYVKDNEGDRIDSKYIIPAGTGDEVSAGTVVLESKLLVGRDYVIMAEGYGEKGVGIDRIYSTPDFVEAFTYEGEDLGALYTHDKTMFRLWAPTASRVLVNLYKTGHEDDLIESIEMTRDINGTYVASVEGDQNGVYYTYSVTSGGVTREAVDPYARTTGVNGLRAMIIDLDSTDPEGWDSDSQVTLENNTDAVLYELHVRDLSTSEDSGIDNAGKFLGLTEQGTVNDDGLATGLDHLKELGITHLHLLPSFDHRSIDERYLEDNNFNWGYDPQNYNVPEGSYSTDPYNGAVRVEEFKQMVKTLHDNNIGVVLDVVYNHTGATEDSNLNKLVPNYYYRKVDGKFSNGSGCGNETASERSMVRKMIVDSVVYWAEEYHLDGFRFDLMGLHDIDTMLAVREALDQVDPSIIIYGEGWTGGASPLPDNKKALKANTSDIPGIAAFSDDIRDGIKGHVFNAEEPGFSNGHDGMEETIKFGVVGATEHDQVGYPFVNYSDRPWAASPEQTVNYVSAHDNLTLYDKFTVTNPEASEDEKKAMVRLSNAIVFTSQGIPFMHAGVEMLRTKDGDHNSYQSSDEVNQIEWHWKSDHQDLFEYHQGLIEFRKAHPALRMSETEMVQTYLRFFGEGEDYEALQLDHEEVVAWLINDHANGDSAGAILSVYNANADAVTLDIPNGSWNVMINGVKAGTEVIETIEGGTVTVDGVSAMVLISETPVDMTSVGLTETTEPEQGDETVAVFGNEEEEESESKKENDEDRWIPFVGAGVVIVAGVAIFMNRKKKS